MRTFSFVFLLFLSITSTYAQGYWTQPVQLTFGPYEDTNPTFINRHPFLFGAEEWLAFTRFNFVGSNIYLIKTNSSASAWLDTVYYITDDSATNSYPSLAQYRYNYNDYRSMIVWQRMNNIYYRYMPDSEWLPMQALTSDSVNNRKPFIAPFDSGFGVVWERNGQIMFSEFRDSTWSSVVKITPDGDSSNLNPKLQYFNFDITFHRPFVIWEKIKLPDTTRALCYSYLRNSNWKPLDTLAWDNDNRNPSFSRFSFRGLANVTWESNIGNWETYLACGFPEGDSIIWSLSENISNTVDKDETEFSFFFLGIITRNIQPEGCYFYPEAATWRSIPHLAKINDQIGVSTSLFYSPTYFSIHPSSLNQHPTLSSGVSISDFFRIWSVWQSDSGGIHHLYGTRTDILLDVKEEQQLPRSPFLLQNYPNPFNPSTTIRFQLESKSYVTLEVYDVIGRNVATLVSGILEAGHHRIVWNAEKFTSGIYYYHLTVVDVSNSHHFYHQAGKAMLLK